MAYRDHPTAGDKLVFRPAGGRVFRQRESAHPGQARLADKFGFNRPAEVAGNGARFGTSIDKIHQFGVAVDQPARQRPYLHGFGIVAGGFHKGVSAVLPDVVLRHALTGVQAADPARIVIP